MADPTSYVPGYSYSGWQATNPSKPLPAPQVDNDFANVSRSVQEIISALQDVRRSDGALANQSVGPDQLSPGLTIGFTMRGAWTEGATYSAGDGVVHESVFYSARVGHVADATNVPSNSSYWNYLFSIDDLVVSGALSLPLDTFTGNGVQTEFDLSFAPVSERNVWVRVGNLLQSVGQYSVSGTTLRIPTPPPAGYEIEVRGLGTTASLVEPTDGSVSEQKLAEGAVATSKLADGSVTTPKLADEAVTTPKIDDEAVTLQKLDPTIQAKLNYLSATKAPAARVERKTTASYGGITYDVITVTGGQRIVTKKFGPDVDPTGLVTRRTPREISKTMGYPVVINADRFSAPDGGSYTTSAQALGRGLQIADGTAYREWQEGTSATTAFVYMSDDTYRVATKADDQAAGKTAQDWVDEGALWSVCAWYFAVIDGVAQTLVDDGPSARTIMGRKSNGDWVFILVEGVTGAYGIQYSQVPALCIAEGLHVAYLLDGGGSTQAWWGNCYAMPSSDTGDPFATAGDGGRKTGGFICVDVPSVPEYDSGYVDLGLPSGLTAGSGAGGGTGVWARQHGPKITIGVNAAASPALGTAVDFVISANKVPERFFGVGAAGMRGMIMAQQQAAGGAAWAAPILVAGDGTLTLRTGNGTIPAPATIGTLTGSWEYDHRWAKP